MSTATESTAPRETLDHIRDGECDFCRQRGKTFALHDYGKVAICVECASSDKMLEAVRVMKAIQDEGRHAYQGNGKSEQEWPKPSKKECSFCSDPGKPLTPFMTPNEGYGYVCERCVTKAIPEMLAYSMVKLSTVADQVETLLGIAFNTIEASFWKGAAKMLARKQRESEMPF